MRIRVEFAECQKITIATDKSKASSTKQVPIGIPAICFHAVQTKSSVCLMLGKIQVGKELMTLPYLYGFEKNFGAMLPPQVCLSKHRLSSIRNSNIVCM